ADRGAVTDRDPPQLPADAARLLADRDPQPDPDPGRALHVRASAARLLDPGLVRFHAQPLRSPRAPDAGLRPGDHHPRAVDPYVAAGPGQVALHDRTVHGARHQRDLRSHRVVDGAGQ